MMAAEAFELLGASVAPGTRRDFEVPISRIFGHAAVNMPVIVWHGTKPGPALLVTAAVHGDELNGVEIIRRLLAMRGWRQLAGTLIAVPVVNTLGVIERSRYLPDRRDLNRMFPGSPHGALAARLAYLITTEILPHAQYAVDLHTGAVHRANLPQIRANLHNSDARTLAEAFGAPVILDAPGRDGSMRGVGDDLGVPIITYEGGEALRFDELAIRAGVRGVLNVLCALEMLPARRGGTPAQSALARGSRWVRASVDGFFRPAVKLGQQVAAGTLLGHIAGPLETRGTPVTAPTAGLVIGLNHLPLVLEGEALLHIAHFHDAAHAELALDLYQAVIGAEEMDDYAFD